MIKFRIDAKGIDKLANDFTKSKKELMPLLSMQVLEDCNRFIPRDTDALMNSAYSASNFKEGEITWTTPYARRLYYNPQYKFSHDKNPQAQGLWSQKAETVYGNDWGEMAKKLIVRGL